MTALHKNLDTRPAEHPKLTSQFKKRVNPQKIAILSCYLQTYGHWKVSMPILDAILKKNFSEAPILVNI